MSSSAFVNGFMAGFEPTPNVNIWQWADKYRILPKGSAEPGNWRTKRTPYLKEIMEELSPQSATSKVIVIKGTQLGFTEVGNNMIGYYIHIEPRAGGMWLPTDALAEKHAKKKLWKMVEETPVLKSRVSERRKGGGASKESSTITEWAFPGGSLSLAGSGSGASFRSDSYSFAIKDDIDGFVDDVDGEGSPIELIDNRTDAFANRKIYENSTPTTKDSSHIETEFEESDQREYYMPCPFCTPKDLKEQNQENLITFNIDNFSYEYDKETFRLKSKVVLICPHCDGEIEEYNKTWMMDWDNGAVWIPHNPGHINRGYRLSSLYSPLGWRGWEDIILERLKAQSKMQTGDVRLMKRWKNTRLAEVWEDDFSKMDIEFLKEKQEDYEYEVPYGVYVLIASVDTQEDRLEILVEGFGYENESWVVDREIFFGDPAQPDIWADLDRFLLNQIYTHENGKMKIYATGIDSGGSKTKYVYQYCKPRYGKRIFALKGASPVEAPAVSKRDAKRSKYKTTFFMVGVKQLKDVVNGSLQMLVPGASYVHFPNTKKFNDDFFEQLISEKKNKTGRWVKRKPNIRNEAFDLMVYTRATLEITALNIGKLKEPLFFNQTTPTRKKRRVISKGVI
jgi:phage terminase large subunit GpA-like protein